MWSWNIIVLGLVVTSSVGYMSPGKEHFLTDALLRDVVDRMGKDLAEAAGAYLDFAEPGRGSGVASPAAKVLASEEQMFPADYDSLGAGNPNPSIRDQEYLEHSSLWGSQFVSGGAGEGKQHLMPEGTVKNHQEVKTDATLPAYCNPPNPCPIGYGEDQGCMLQFENTAAFSRHYQGAQDCMCDSEHMFECQNQEDQRSMEAMAGNLADVDFNRFLQHTLKEQSINPYLAGERLPVAAKKGTHVVY